jgi:hypothetical protein
MKSSFIVLIQLIAITGGRTGYGLQTVKPIPTTAAVATATRNILTNIKPVALARPKWGVDKGGHPDEYWFDQRIHSLGNVGFSGALHAAMAPAFTKLIDWKAYKNVDIRKQVCAQSTIHCRGGPVPTHALTAATGF